MTAPRYGSWNPVGKPDLVSTVTPLDTRGPARLWNAPAGYVVRERGDVDGTVTLEFLCPVHGRFEARASRRETPDEVPCASCGAASPWSPSKFNAWQSSGEVKS